MLDASEILQAVIAKVTAEQANKELEVKPPPVAPIKPDTPVAPVLPVAPRTPTIDKKGHNL